MRAILILLATILLIVAITIPSLRGMYDRAEVDKLIEELEHYKAKHGEYPEDLEQLGISITFCNEGPHGVEYRVHDEQGGFTLSCFGRGPVIFSEVWEIYSSETKNWTRMSE